MQSSVNNATGEGTKVITGKPQKSFLRYCKKVLTFNNLQCYFTRKEVKWSTKKQSSPYWLKQKTAKKNPLSRKKKGNSNGVRTKPPRQLTRSHQGKTEEESSDSDTEDEEEEQEQETDTESSEEGEDLDEDQSGVDEIEHEDRDGKELNDDGGEDLEEGDEEVEVEGDEGAEAEGDEEEEDVEEDGSSASHSAASAEEDEGDEWLVKIEIFGLF